MIWKQQSPVSRKLATPYELQVQSEVYRKTHHCLTLLTLCLFVGTEGTISKIYHLDILKSCP